jgi:hypothetical protein
MRQQIQSWLVPIDPADAVPLARRASFFDHLVAERDAFGVIFLESCFRGVDVRKHLELLGVTDLLVRVDVDPDCFHRTILCALRGVKAATSTRYPGR